MPTLTHLPAEYSLESDTPQRVPAAYSGDGLALMRAVELAWRRLYSQAVRFESFTDMHGLIVFGLESLRPSISTEADRRALAEQGYARLLERHSTRQEIDRSGWVYRFDEDPNE